MMCQFEFTQTDRQDAEGGVTPAVCVCVRNMITHFCGFVDVTSAFHG